MLIYIFRIFPSFFWKGHAPSPFFINLLKFTSSLSPVPASLPVLIFGLASYPHFLTCRPFTLSLPLLSPFTLHVFLLLPHRVTGLCSVIHCYLRAITHHNNSYNHQNKSFTPTGSPLDMSKSQVAPITRYT